MSSVNQPGVTAPGEVDTLPRVASLAGVETTAIDPMDCCCHPCRCSLGSAPNAAFAITPTVAASVAAPVVDAPVIWMPLLLLLFWM